MTEHDKLLPTAESLNDQAANILGEEANQLSSWLSSNDNKALPHRVALAVRLEMRRLRMIADAIKTKQTTGQ